MTRKPLFTALAFPLRALLVVPAVCLLLPACKPNTTGSASPAAPPTPADAKAKPGTASQDKTVAAPKFSPEDIAQLEEKAKQNDPEALLQLGRAYLEGHGKPNDAKKAAECFRKAADLGNWKAQNNLGLMYGSGRGIERNPAEALKWLRAAASQGAVTAQVNLASQLAQGEMVPKDFHESAEWYEKAAAQGSQTAQHELGRLYFHGQNDLPQDYALAAKWLQMAADQGDGWAVNTLGAMAETGLGEPRDDHKALQLYRRSAEMGDAKGQGNAARLLQGVGNDKVEAYKWMYLSKAQGESMGEVPFKDFQFELTPQELAAARRLIADYQKQHPRQTAKND